MIILETPRLLFRRFETSDLGSLYELYCDPDVRRYIPDAPRSLEEAREELEWHQNGHPQDARLGLWAAIHKESGGMIGRCGLLPWRIDGRDEVEVAYLFGKAWWGRGLGSEAAAGIRDYAFGKLGFRRLICMVEHENLASIRVAVKIGMHFEKESRDETGPFLVYSMERPARQE